MIAKTIFNYYFKKRIKLLRNEKNYYNSSISKDLGEIENIQVDKFNKVWNKSFENIPFYKEWKYKNSLPCEIKCVNDLDLFPILTKEEISNKRDLISKTPGIERNTLTGGTSGISTPFPMNFLDADTSWINTHIGRSWNSIEPRDKLFMIWGHSHLFQGRGAIFKHLKRKAADHINKIFRVSAYDVSDENLDHIVSQILKVKPVYIIGYGSCMGYLADFIQRKNISLRNVNVKRIVNTSETISKKDAKILSNIFECPVINEYGMAETGVIGYSQNSLYPIRVFTNDFIVRIKAQRLIITTLGNKCFPLINYDTEDLSSDVPPKEGFLSSIKSLDGKARDVFEIKDIYSNLHKISVIILDHIFKQIGELRSLHFEIRSNHELIISYNYSGNRPSKELLMKTLAQGLETQGIEIEESLISFKEIDSPLLTIAGKRQTLSR